MTGVVDLNTLATHIIDHNSTFSRGTVVGVLIELGTCVRELLLQGYKVSLGEIGEFYPSIHSKGASSMELFTTDNIRRVKANFTMGSALQNLTQDAQFTRVSTRYAQAATLAAQMKGETTVDISPDDEDDGE